MTPCFLILTVAAGKDNGNTFPFPIIPYQHGRNYFPALTCFRLQFLIQICFAVKTTKAQVNSFVEKIGETLDDNFIAYEQLFLGLFQCKSPKNVIPLNLKTKSAKNVLCQELFIK